MADEFGAYANKTINFQPKKGIFLIISTQRLNFKRRLNLRSGMDGACVDVKKNIEPRASNFSGHLASEGLIRMRCGAVLLPKLSCKCERHLPAKNFRREHIISFVLRCFEKLLFHLF